MVDLQAAQTSLEDRYDALQKKLSVSTIQAEDRTLLKWVRENVMAPAKMLGWAVAISLGAALSYLVEKTLSK
jgi:hypothetical protein